MSIFIEKIMEKEFSGNWSLSLKAVAAEYTAPNRSDIITEGGQDFRVMDVVKERSGKETYINVQARHIAFDLEDILVTKGKVLAPSPAPDNMNIKSGYGKWQVEYQLKGTLSEHLSELSKYCPGFTLSSGTVAGTRTVTVTEGTVFENLIKILDQFNAGYELNNKTVTAVSFEDAIGQTATAEMHYGVNNINMSRSSNYEDIIAKLYAKAKVPSTEVYSLWALSTVYSKEDKVTYNSINYVCISDHESTSDDEPGVGINWGTYWQEEELVEVISVIGAGVPEYLVDFGEFEDEATFNTTDQAYYDIRSNPQPRYEVGVAELKKHPDFSADTSFTFDVGDVANVIDPDLGLNENMVIVGYSYSLLTDSIDSYSSTVRLGTLDKERIPPRLEIFEKEVTAEDIENITNIFYMRTESLDVKELIAMTRDYIQEQIFGGTVKEINSNLLDYAARFTDSYPLGLGWETGEAFSGTATFVGLDNVVNGLNNFVTSGTAATTYSSAFETIDPVDFVKEDALVGISSWQFRIILKYWIDSYVSSTSNIAASLNSVYDSVIAEPGTVSSITIENQPPAIMKRIDDNAQFSAPWKAGVSEVIDYAINQVGNPTGIYQQLGGGRSGIIPCINELWDEITNLSLVEVTSTNQLKKYNNPAIFTSELDPDNTKGSDGDVWLKYTISRILG